MNWLHRWLHAPDPEKDRIVAELVKEQEKLVRVTDELRSNVRVVTDRHQNELLSVLDEALRVIKRRGER